MAVESIRHTIVDVAVSDSARAFVGLNVLHVRMKFACICTIVICAKPGKYYICYRGRSCHARCNKVIPCLDV